MKELNLILEMNDLGLKVKDVKGQIEGVNTPWICRERERESKLFHKRLLFLSLNPFLLFFFSVSL